MAKIKLQKRDTNLDLQAAWDNLILTIAKDFKLDKFADWLSRKLSKSRAYCQHECPYGNNKCYWSCFMGSECQSACKLNPNECEKREKR